MLRIWLAFLTFIPATASIGQTAAPPTIPEWSDLGLDIPLVDLPFSVGKNPILNPSMTQSLNLTKDVYRVFHWGLEHKFDPYEHGWDGFGARTMFAVADIALMSLPFGQGWMHEEWHRAVMSHRDIDSHNGIYTHFFTSTVPVDRESDEDIARLKADHPEDFIRLDEAGMESELQLAESLDADVFYGKRPTFDFALHFLAVTSPIFYIQTCATSDANKITDQGNDEDGADVRSRDFTGLDCDGWAYDIDRPNEPYSARGTHPSGVGINRYRHLDDLSDREKDLLSQQRRLTFLNLVDPMMLGWNAFHAPFGEWNFAMRHYLSSFGYALDTDLYFKAAGLQGELIAHAFVNGAKTMPGLELRLLDLPVHRGFHLVTATVRAMAWQQPRELLFDTTEAQLGGALFARFDTNFYGRYAGWNPYVESGCKSQGWLAGNVAQEHACSLVLGAEMSTAALE